jgi:hypothetical protein
MYFTCLLVTVEYAVEFYLQATSCPHCGRALPRCSICLMTLGIVRDDERNYDLMRSRFKGAFIHFLMDCIILCSGRLIQILSTMRLSSVRPVDTEDTHPIYSTGFSVRTGSNLIQHVLSQIVIAVVLKSFRAKTSCTFLCRYFSVLILISYLLGLGCIFHNSIMCTRTSGSQVVTTEK